MRLGSLVGGSVKLRLVTLDDAEYIYALRTSSEFNRHLSAAPASVNDQIAWINGCKDRERRGEDFYFVIVRLDSGERCGVVRVYNVKDGSFTWGSWIIDNNKPPKAALDCALLIYRFGFSVLQCKHCMFDVRRSNEHTLRFHRRFGARETGSDQYNIYFEINRDEFASVESELSGVIKCETRQEE